MGHARMNHWYLVQFKPNSHRLAEHNLKRQDFKTFLPLQKITRRKSSKFVSDLKPLFPGYMFVSFMSGLSPWRKINSTIGVSKLVTSGGAPRSVPTQLINELMFRCDPEGILLPPKILNTGDCVEMLTGPFAKFIATIEKVEPNHRVWLLIEFLGQKTRLQVDGDHVQLSR